MPMHRLGCLTLGIAIFLVLVLPVLYYKTVEAALLKLGVPPDLAVIFFLAMLIGSAINIPIWKIPSRRYVKLDPLAVVGLPGFLPHLEDLRKELYAAQNTIHDLRADTDAFRKLRSMLDAHDAELQRP